MSESQIVVLIILLFYSPVFYHLVLAIKEDREGIRKSLKRFYKYLKISFLCLLLLLIGILVISHTNYLDYEKPIKFEEYDQITFENFRGIELFKKSLYGNERFAYVMTSIDYEIEEDGVKVQSLFHPSRSFVYKKNVFSEELLAHEKYHFKVTELFARKAKKQISSLQMIDQNEIKKIINKAKKEEKDFQKQYDHDTFHSYIYGEQNRYEKEIDSMLVLLSDYVNPKIRYHEND